MQEFHRIKDPRLQLVSSLEVGRYSKFGRILVLVLLSILGSHTCDFIVRSEDVKNSLLSMYKNETFQTHFYNILCYKLLWDLINLLKPNDIYIYIYIYIYICRTAALTSRRYILNIYSTNLRTEYFKHAA